MRYSLPTTTNSPTAPQELWITDEHGTKLMPLEVLFHSFRRGGLGIGRYIINDKVELAHFFRQNLPDLAGDEDGCQFDEVMKDHLLSQIADFVVSCSVKMPPAVLNAEGYSLDQKVEHALKLKC